VDDQGMALTSDVIAAAQWILDNKSKYNIKVANFSLTGSVASSFMHDPLDRAVEKLWFNGVTVVAATGNYGTADGPSGVRYAPGNDPFVISVGAADLMATGDPSDDTVAYWSAYGRTPDGFSKPDIVAPGRYMVGAVPTLAQLSLLKPSSILAPGYMQLSGTSFAAPVVSGTVAQILALHPSWTPDQVKGALMASARPMPAVANHAGGVGELDAVRAAYTVNPVNPNAPLEQFATLQSSGDVAFDEAAFKTTVSTNVSWDTVSWDTVSWDTVSWDTVSWDTVSWDTVSWDTVSWDTVSWDTVSWDTVSWDTVSWDTVSWDTASDADGVNANYGVSALGQAH
jgi:serine protease AprX